MRNLETAGYRTRKPARTTRKRRLPSATRSRAYSAAGQRGAGRRYEGDYR